MAQISEELLAQVQEARGVQVVNHISSILQER